MLGGNPQREQSIELAHIGTYSPCTRKEFAEARQMLTELLELVSWVL